MSTNQRMSLVMTFEDARATRATRRLERGAPLGRRRDARVSWRPIPKAQRPVNARGSSRYRGRAVRSNPRAR